MAHAIPRVAMILYPPTKESNRRSAPYDGSLSGLPATTTERTQIYSHATRFPEGGSAKRSCSANLIQDHQLPSKTRMMVGVRCVRDHVDPRDVVPAKGPDSERRGAQPRPLLYSGDNDGRQQRHALLLEATFPTRAASHHHGSRAFAQGRVRSLFFPMSTRFFSSCPLQRGG
jgi:hypothetical protein